MNTRRIIVVAVLAAGIPFLVGFFFGLFGGHAAPETASWLLGLRRWSIRILVTLVFLWFGWVQRERLIQNALISVGVAWILAEFLSLGSTLGFAMLFRALPPEALPQPVPPWFLSFSYLIQLSILSAIGVGCGYVLRLVSERRREAI